ncbi:enoyl-CoA hydratase/isomerase family protein [Variovorax sp. efr-133-TYG-130]|uniref:enoyl-CoA hydratase/isomerase family protein n=1 Tax=Variovorax sp. efr-133-TYG-130 TaxID=3040327 RepID=UPI002553C5AE|nr:enoyl-CoA hydratase/isomerase family protein [Variovorax sp. efr-133-TYG-130]
MSAGEAVPDGPISLDWTGAVAVLTICRSERRNAIDGETALRMAAILDDLRVDQRTRAVVLRGAGDHFCAGGDVRKSEGRQRSPEERLGALAPYHRLTTVLASYTKPVVAAIDGVAFGAGFSLALLADLIVVSDRARLCMAFERLGLVPDLGALYTLPRAVGMQRARELLLSAREVNAQEAKHLGLALEVVRAEQLLTRSIELAASLTNASPVAISCIKAGLAQSFTSDLQVILNLESAAQAVATDTTYFAESVRRLSAREPAQFQWPSE